MFYLQTFKNKGLLLRFAILLYWIAKSAFRFVGPNRAVEKNYLLITFS